MAQSIMKLGYRCRILSSAITISSQETYSAPKMRLHFCVVPLVQALVHSVREDPAIVHVILLAPR